MMNEVEVSLVQKSYKRLMPTSHRIAKYFYSRLFEMDVSLEPVFAEDLLNHGQQFISMLDLIVNASDKIETIIPELKEEGLRLKESGVKPDKYQTMGAVFIDSLAFGLGNDFSPNVMNAWVKLYKAVTRQMIEGANY